MAVTPSGGGLGGVSVGKFSAFIDFVQVFSAFFMFFVDFSRVLCGFAICTLHFYGVFSAGVGGGGGGGEKGGEKGGGGGGRVFPPFPLTPIFYVQ